MALTQTGATYKNRAELARRDHLLGEALDDIASQSQSTRTQGNFGIAGKPSPPSMPASLAVSAASGIITATIVHNNAPAGTQYRLEYSTTPNFLNPLPVDLGEVPMWQQSLPGQKLYFRVATKFSASELTKYVYFGSQASPAMVNS